VDYYLHHSDHRIRYNEVQDRLFKQALACFTLHCASRPWNEMIAWTLHFEALKLNLFLTGDNETGAITGRLFDEDVKVMDGNFFFADVVRPKQPKRRSVAQFDGNDIFSAIQAFYSKSEQRGVRAFELSDEKYALIAEHPDFDAAWFATVDAAALERLDKEEELGTLEKRVYRWHCGCNQARMMEVLAPVYRDDPDGVFGEDERIEMRCPRCGARHQITREEIRNFVAGIGEHGGDKGKA
jgi:molecular chaperone Hsp33